MSVQLRQARWPAMLVILCAFVLQSLPALAKPPTQVKSVVNRSENPDRIGETLILPFAFSAESTDLVFGVGGMRKGHCAIKVDGGVGGAFDLTIAYATPFEDVLIELTVNGMPQTIACPPTGSWKEIKQVNQTIQLKPGRENHIEIKSLGQNLSIDHFELLGEHALKAD